MSGMPGSEKSPLSWPAEAARKPAPGEPVFRQGGAGICLDLHGDPLNAGLAVFSDGNHHMALEECAATFLEENPDVEDVFYATTPPGPLVEALATGVLHVGNLALSVSPHVFIGPTAILEALAASNAVADPRPFMRSRGNVLLVRQGNPKNIGGVADLLRHDVGMAISNPATEKASFEVYRDTLAALAETAGLDAPGLRARLSEGGERVVFSAAIHHRELPQLLADGAADVAMVYYHLALRYCRIFPELFDLVPLGGTREDPRPGPEQRITGYRIGLVGDGGAWGPRFLEFMLGAGAGEIYRKHGLRRP